MNKTIEGIEKKIKEYKRLLKNNKPLDYGEGVVEGLEEALELVKNNCVLDDVIKCDLCNKDRERNECTVVCENC